MYVTSLAKLAIVMFDGLNVYRQVLQLDSYILYKFLKINKLNENFMGVIM